MRLVFTESAWQDYLWFQEKERRLLRRINQLIKDTLRTPFEGLGKPEPLKADLSGYWLNLPQASTEGPARYRIRIGQRSVSIRVNP
jgi:toxin YoeB